MVNRQTERLLMILNQSESATAVYDTAELNIAFANQAMLRIWGRDDRIVGHSFDEVFPDFTEQGFTAILKEVWETGKTYRAAEIPIDITIRGIKETKYFDITYQAVADEQGKTYAIIHTTTDVSVRHSVLKMTEDQDVVIAFNNELEALTNTLSHDLMNPLSLAKMGVQYLKKQEDLTPEQKNRCISLVTDALFNVESIIAIALCDVKKIMTRIHGDIKVKSTVGEGTVVELYFPNKKTDEKKM